MAILLAQHPTDDLEALAAETLDNLAQVVGVKLPADANAERALVPLAGLDFGEQCGRLSGGDVGEALLDEVGSGWRSGLVSERVSIPERMPDDSPSANVSSPRSSGALW